ncbi:DUF748 domain-containing protein [Caballeronia sordidicola]|uniref:Putative exported protein n=1 Tax=Caballeronia sordidicola TaxID=196367 RepID=A0A242MRF8_CABSO|nr:DUF748 domain-containing protein [Caballeronia sordidicola]OTP73911.1 putative exported protein [Caballeronia sordidicola]
MVRELKLQVAELLGPNGSAEHIVVGFFMVTLTRIELRAPREWPTKDLFRAEHAVFKLDWRTLFARRVHAQYVFVDHYYLSVVRADNGGLRVLPRFTLEEREADGQSRAAAKRANADKLIDRIVFRDGTVELVDEAIRKPPYRILITNADGEAHHVRLPDLSDPTSIALTGSLHGPSHEGTVSSKGSITFSNSDSRLQTQLRNVDIALFDPYLIKEVGSTAKARSGTIDLALDTTVQNGRIHAPGSFVVKNLQLTQSENAGDTIASVPAKSAVAALKDPTGTIKLKFELDGNLQDPHFSLTQSVGAEIMKGFPRAVASGASGIAKGAAQAVEGIGRKLGSLFSK